MLDSNFYINTRFDRNACNLFQHITRTMHVDQTFMDPHLEPIPSFWAFTTRCFTCCDTKYFRGHANWSFHEKILFFCSIDKLLTNYNILIHRKFFSASILLLSLCHSIPTTSARQHSILLDQKIQPKIFLWKLNPNWLPLKNFPLFITLNVISVYIIIFLNKTFQCFIFRS